MATKRPFRKDHPQRRAFTLIELLVVISILVLLMALLLPALSRARKQGKAVVCQGNLRQWGVIYSMYLGDNEDCFPADFKSEAMQRYFDFSGNLGLIVCPMARARRHEEWSRGAGGYRGQGGTFMAWDWGSEIFGSYGGNGFLPYLDATDPAYDDRMSVYWMRLPLAAAQVPVLFDCMNRRAVPESRDAPPEAPDVAPLVGADGMELLCMDRHGGGINMLFADWSAPKVGVKEPWTFRWHREYNTAGPWTKAGGALPSDWPKWMRNFKDY